MRRGRAPRQVHTHLKTATDQATPLSRTRLSPRFSYLPWYRRLGGRWTLGPFVLGITVPNILVSAFPDALPDELRLLSLLGAVWIYAVQFDLYQRVNLMAKGAPSCSHRCAPRRRALARSAIRPADRPRSRHQGGANFHDLP